MMKKLKKYCVAISLLFIILASYDRSCGQEYSDSAGSNAENVGENRFHTLELPFIDDPNVNESCTPEMLKFNDFYEEVNNNKSTSNGGGGIECFSGCVKPFIESAGSLIESAGSLNEKKAQLLFDSFSSDKIPSQLLFSDSNCIDNFDSENKKDPEFDWYPILMYKTCIEKWYRSNSQNSGYRQNRITLRKWADIIYEKNPDSGIYQKLGLPSNESGRQSFLGNPNEPYGGDWNGFPSPLPTNSLTPTNTPTATNTPTETIAPTATNTPDFLETERVKENLMETENASQTAVANSINLAATAVAQANRNAAIGKAIQISLISLGVIGLGAAVFLFIFTQRKRKAAYQMRFEQRRINAVPAPHLFDVEPKARPASAMPSGVSVGGEGNFERSITIEPAEELSDSATMEIDMGSSSVLRYDFGNIQHQGSREYQEDSFGFSDVADPNLVASRGILAVLADGMGGLKNGKSISERTVAKFRKAFMSFTPGVEVPRQLYSLVHETNAEIYQTDKQKGGTTLICVYIYGNSMYWVSVGDSAIYLFRQGRMYQLNREHNRLNDLYLRFMYREITKAQLLAEPTLQGLTSNIGRKELRDVDQNLRELRLRRGDRILLCSDGVSGRLTEKEMLVAMSQGNAQKCTDALKNFVLKKKAPKQDNLTAQVISCD